MPGNIFNEGMRVLDHKTLPGYAAARWECTDNTARGKGL